MADEIEIMGIRILIRDWMPANVIALVTPGKAVWERNQHGQIRLRFIERPQGAILKFEDKAKEDTHGTSQNTIR